LKLFISPHNDDETLFGAFTLLRERPLVAVVFDSFVQERRGYGITAAARRAETRAACEVLGVSCGFLGLRDDSPDWRAVRWALAEYKRSGVTEVWAPAVERDGHLQHNEVGAIAGELFPRVTYYLTYTRTGGKSTAGRLVPFENAWIGIKLRALAEYRSQIGHASTAEHFIRDQREYVE